MLKSRQKSDFLEDYRNPGDVDTLSMDFANELEEDWKPFNPDKISKRSLFESQEIHNNSKPHESFDTDDSQAIPQVSAIKDVVWGGEFNPNSQQASQYENF